MASKTCFVIMPIKHQGTPEYDYFRALHDTVISPSLREAGYEVIRADDIHNTGWIPSQVVKLLATADLVVADLTDINANVFYELGIRHTLHARGTIMVIDTTRTEVPFDLRQYRVIEFTPDLRGFQKVREMLAQFAAAVSGEIPDTVKDNPVHDILPSLPADIYKHAEGSTEGELREEVARLRTTLQRYADAQGVTVDALGSGQDLLNTVTVVLGHALRGELPIDLLQQAHSHARAQDRSKFLATLRQILEQAGTGEISAENLLALARDAGFLDIETVRVALLERATQLRPNDLETRRTYLTALAHSEDAARRADARRGLLAHLGLSLGDEGTVELPTHLDRTRLLTLANMLDAYHRDGLDDEALRITTALIERFPDSTVVLRNHARALRTNGRSQEALEFYRAAAMTPDADDTSAVWYGTALTNERRLVDAIEAYLTACRFDPDDATNFANVADAISDALRDVSIGRKVSWKLPAEVTVETVILFLSATFSCTNVDGDTLRLATVAAERGEIPQEIIAELYDIRRNPNAAGDGDVVRFLDRRERIALTRELSRVLANASETAL